MTGYFHPLMDPRQRLGLMEAAVTAKAVHLELETEDLVAEVMGRVVGTGVAEVEA